MERGHAQRIPAAPRSRLVELSSGSDLRCAILRTALARTDFILITCEHGGNRIPAPYRPIFSAYRKLLDSHRGYDLGALRLARELARALDAPLVASTVSRLLVDLNRSVGHPQVFSKAMHAISPELREQIVERYYRPHRIKIERYVEQAVAQGRRVIHLACHSFTPKLDGVSRRADVGLLYDPSRVGEVALCARWKRRLAIQAPALEVRRNYPYLGKNDGLTTSLRRRFGPAAYVGVEIEINQKHVFDSAPGWGALRYALIQSLRAALV
jgi:predicted N-formylglutamate amidohydrolase